MTQKTTNNLPNNGFSEQELIGKTFGKMTVLSIYKDGSNAKKCLCRCECGHEKEAYLSNLMGGRTRSCGCSAGGRKNKKDITGKRFGLLVAIRPTKERRTGSVVWECRCDCGNIVLWSRKELLSRRTPNCGCLGVRKGVRPHDLTGHKYGRLTVLNITDKRTSKGSAIWHCRCDCGNYIDVQAPLLVSGGAQSCGCMKLESMAEARRKMHYVDGTCLEKLNGRPNSNPLHKGVSRRKNGNYMAKICMQKRQYYLGTFRDYEAAVKVREAAETVLFGSFIRDFQEWQNGDQTEPFHFEALKVEAVLEQVKSHAYVE